ncbi:MAG: hypothetical protein R3E87_10765 [Burkholderiaceae bacterium]
MNESVAPAGSGAGHVADAADRALRIAFESGALATSEFDHRAHLRVAYALLCERSFDDAVDAMRRALRGFLAHHGIEPDRKYHETLTLAWMSAVRLFMERSAPMPNSREFLVANPRLLDAGIMGIHYSRERLFSDSARASFVAPDRAPLPVFA